MSVVMPTCPACKSSHVVKNGKIHNGKQNFRCRDCGRQFVQNPPNKIIDQATKDLINKLLLEKIPLAGIARVTGVSEPWLQSYVNTLYQTVPKQVDVRAKKSGCDPAVVARRHRTRTKQGRLTIECDEMWSFVGNKGNKQWIWLALDSDRREIVGVYVGGKRSYAVSAAPLKGAGLSQPQGSQTTLGLTPTNLSPVCRLL